MFVYIRVLPNNPINARAPSLGPRLSLFSEVSYAGTIVLLFFRINACYIQVFILHLFPRKARENTL